MISMIPPNFVLLIKKTKTMQKAIKTIFACAIVGTLFCVSSLVFAEESHSACSGNDILIAQRPLTPQGAPRTTVPNPFFATQETSFVLLGSYFECGIVTVTLVSTAGDYYTTDFDTEDGQIIIPISGDSGHYTLTLVTERGLVFEGTFEL